MEDRAHIFNRREGGRGEGLEEREEVDMVRGRGGGIGRGSVGDFHTHIIYPWKGRCTRCIQPLDTDTMT